MAQPEPWTGTSSFSIQAGMEDPTCFAESSEEIPKFQSCEAEIHLTIDDFHKCLGKTYDFQENYLASAAKRQKVEVKIKELSIEDQKKFAQAKEKEMESWFSTETVRKILRNKVPEGQLLRSRWVLSWKTLDEKEQAETGLSRKPKAPLKALLL